MDSFFFRKHVALLMAKKGGAIYIFSGNLYFSHGKTNSGSVAIGYV